MLNALHPALIAVAGCRAMRSLSRSTGLLAALGEDQAVQKQTQRVVRGVEEQAVLLWF